MIRKDPFSCVDSEVWYPLRYHETQWQAWTNKKQFTVICAGRGSGKTELARRRIVYHLPIKKRLPPIYVWGMPTFQQAKRVAWKELNRLIPKEWVVDRNVSDLMIETIFGSTLYIVGLDKPQRIEGMQIDGCVVDESSDIKPGAFDRSILPMLSQRDPWVWRIGVPKRHGIGRVEFKQNFEWGVAGHPDIAAFWWESEGLIPEKARIAAARRMDPQDYEEQYRAKWIDVGGGIYHSFSKENVSESAKYERSFPIIIGCDFNVNPMCWVLGHKIDGKVYIFDEVFIRNTNTRKTLDHIITKYESHPSGWAFYGDASSTKRHTSAVKTDYLHIKNDTRFDPRKVFFLLKNPAVRDRFATVNAGLCNALGEKKIFINPKCTHLIKDLEVMTYKEDTMEPEEYRGTDIGHTADAFGYMIMRVLPLKLHREGTPRIIAA